MTREAYDNFCKNQIKKYHDSLPTEQLDDFTRFVDIVINKGTNVETILEVIENFKKRGFNFVNNFGLSINDRYLKEMSSAAKQKKKALLNNHSYEISEKMAEQIACLEGAYAAIPKANTIHPPYDVKKAQIACQYKNILASYQGAFTQWKYEQYLEIFYNYYNGFIDDDTFSELITDFFKNPFFDK